MEVALHRDAIGDAVLHALQCPPDKRHTAGIIGGGNAVFGHDQITLERFCHLAEDVFQCLRIDLVIHLGQFCALRGALADKDLRLGYAEHLCILHGSMMILLFIRSRVFSVPIVTGLCGAKRRKNIMFQKKPSASEVDGVQYRRAKTWQIICYACNAFVGMSVYSLIGMASYSASIGYGITTATVGIILMLARILDGFTDPLLAFVYDRVNTRFGKLRVLLISGYLIEAVGLLCMFNLCSSKGFGLPVFALTYIIYIIGYTVTNMTAQTLPAIMTNDPRQRPTIGVWTTALNYAVPMGMSMLIYTVILPKCGGTFNQDFLSTVCTIVLIIAGIGTLIVCAGISAYDKPENFDSISKNHEPLKVADILEVLKHNKPLQRYIASNASDNLAQQVGSQAIINTMLNGILIGNMGLATTLSMISMVPSIFFAAFGAKYVGKKGSKKGIVTWTCISMTITTVLILFFIFTDTRQIGVIGSWNMIVYVLLTLLQNGSNMCITTSNNSYMADTIDYELDRSGRYIPAVVSGTYSLIDKLITSVAAVIATGAVALLGYTTTMPQPTDAYTSGIFWMTLAIKYGLPMLGWVVTLLAMVGCPLTKEEMVNVQKRIADKKDALRHEVIAENMQ